MKIEELKDKIVAYRTRNNYSMREFADLCGVTLQTIWNIENETHKPLKTTTYKIMQVLDNEVL